MDQQKYTVRDFKGDLIAGTFNGSIFGLVYSFFYLPVDRLDPKVFSKCRNSPALYFLMNALKMGAGFAIMRTTYNWTKKEEMEPAYQVGACAGAFGLIMTFI